MTSRITNTTVADNGFAIEAEALTRIFGDLMAVDHLDCRVPYGQMIVGGESIHGFANDFGIMIVIFAVLSATAARLYPTLLR